VEVVQEHLGRFDVQAGTALLMSLGFMVVTVLGGLWGLGHLGRTVFGLLRVKALPALTGAWLGRRLRAMAPATQAAGLVHGALVRVRGVVEGEALLRATLTGTGAVVCGHALGEPGGAVVGEGLQARDFLLRLEDGTPVRVWAKDAAARGHLRLLDQTPHGWKGHQSVGGWFRESRLVPGDQVEILGCVQVQVDPDAARLSDRQAPVCWTLTAAHSRLLLRFATRALATERGRRSWLAPSHVG
jgi:hypothetical protein